jgi:superfamily II DNA/RNA helicase
LARSLIWQEGTLPPDAPPFADALTDDLFDYGYGLLAMAVRLRDGQYIDLSNDALLVAGEAIEAAIIRGDPARRDRMTHRLVAAIAFHLAGYAARAFCMFPETIDADLLSPSEAALTHLLRRSFVRLRATLSGWLLDDTHTDTSWAARLHDESEFDESDAVSEALTAALLRALATFDHALKSGLDTEAQTAKEQLLKIAASAADLKAVPHWWNAMLAYHLIDGLWRTSLHQRLPLEPNDESGAWNTLRSNYIDRLRMRPRAAVEFWPSQLSAAARSLDRSDNLVVALPTSAGKTRIAELCILRALADEKRIVYVTPLRALSSQVEHDLADTFVPLGFRVSALYGSAGTEAGDARTLKEGVIVVATPEKLDFALRNDPTLLDDVGLIVFDEGHMLGPGEREVRYEALVQRLLRRDDAGLRRVVCLSALFPSAGEMVDLVQWIRRDREGEPVHSTWRPTRQRFGTLVWNEQHKTARLEIDVEDQHPYINKYITPTQPPVGSRRRSTFPNEKNELVLAAAWKFAEQKKDVLIYCALKRSVETLGVLALKCIEHGVLTSLRLPTSEVLEAIDIGIEWLGAEHPAVNCLRHGIALHHGSLPRQFLNSVEQLLRDRRCPVVIASPTLAQGLNLSASILFIPSLWRNKQIIPALEFANVAGRAGRAFVDLEGLIVHVVWEESTRKRNARLREWSGLIQQMRASAVRSGLLVLAQNLLRDVSLATGAAPEQAIERLTGSAGWDLAATGTDDPDVLGNWEVSVASIDAAILGLVDADVETEHVGDALDEVLRGSLFARQIERLEARLQVLSKRVLSLRASVIWQDSSAAQRRGYHFAGVGFRAGRFLDDHRDELVNLLMNMEFALATADAGGAIEAATEFATIVFRIHPFQPTGLPDGWESALACWLSGRPATEVIKMVNDGADLVQDAFGYRLPWAMEAVRVHAAATSTFAAVLEGNAALAVETGSLNRSTTILLRSGMRSRELAKQMIEETNADFVDYFGMIEWATSDRVRLLTQDADWPFPRAGLIWRAFRDSLESSDSRRWSRDKQEIAVRWNVRPDSGTPVLIESNGDVMSIAYQRLGTLAGDLNQPRANISRAMLAPNGRIEVHYYGVHVTGWTQRRLTT